MPTTTLVELFDYLDGLEGRAALPALAAQLAQLDMSCADLEEHINFSDRSYARNLVRAGPYYYALVLCWKNGQRSPIHNHRGSTCGVRVLRGILTETRFDFAANGMIKATGSREYLPGNVIASQDSDIHQVSNLQAGNADLVTLHVYSPPLLYMETYSLVDTSRGREPMLLEFSEAAGI